MCVEKSLKPFLSLLQFCGKDPLYLHRKQNDWLLKNYVIHIVKQQRRANWPSG